MESSSCDGAQSISSNAVQAPDLPATAWASVCDYLPYGSVRSLLSTCHAFSRDVPCHIQTLNVFRHSELRVPLARRFAPNASTVNLFCVVETESTPHPAIPTVRSVHSQHLSPEAVICSVPFFQSFPRLKTAFVGGMEKKVRRRRRRGGDGNSGKEPLERSLLLRTVYDPTIVESPSDHERMFRGLIEAFCGAFRAGAISPDVDVRGVVDGTHSQSVPRFKCIPHIAPPRYACGLCRSVCMHFPLEIVARLDRKSVVYDRRPPVLGDLCMSDADRFTTIAKRPGGDRFLASDQPLLILLSQTVNFQLGTLVPSDLAKRMQCKGVKDMNVYFLEAEVVQRIKLLCNKFDCNPKLLDRRSLRNLLVKASSNNHNHDGAKRMILKSTWDGLTSCFFDLRTDDFEVVDEEVEPDLHFLCGRTLESAQGLAFRQTVPR